MLINEKGNLLNFKETTMATQGKTISITIPEQLEEYMNKGAKEMGVSRSRYITTILLNWQSEKRGVMMEENSDAAKNGDN